MRRFCLLAIAIMVLFISDVAAQYRTIEGVTKQRLLDLINNHPDAKLRSDMLSWYRQGKFKIIVDLTIPDLAWRMVHEAGNNQVGWPGLLVNPDFFFSTYVEPELQKKDPKSVIMEKFGAVFHEYLHLVNHFSGRHPLPDGITKTPIQKQAEFHWNTEVDSYWGQWKFLKRMGYGFLMIPPEDVIRMGEWQAFVRKTYGDLKVSPNYTKYGMYWGKLFQEELKRPRS